MRILDYLVQIKKQPRMWIPLLIIIVLLVLAVFFNFWQGKKQITQVTDEKEGILYENKDLGFSLMLPAEPEEFIYRQVQRKNGQDFTDIEIFVPTSDKIYAQEVPGYAKPIVVRVYIRQAWENIKDGTGDKIDFNYQGVKNDKVYAIKFWSNIPIDWNSKWTEKTKKYILDHFKLY